MFLFETISILIAAILAGDIGNASANHTHTRTLPNVNTINSLAQSIFQQQSAALPGAFGNVFAQQFLFQLSQFGNIVALLSNISQPINGPQSESDDASSPVKQRVLRPFNTSLFRPIYTTLPFNDLNLTEFSWILGDPITPDSDNKKENDTASLSVPKEKFFGTE